MPNCAGIPCVLPSGPKRVVCRWLKPTRATLMVLGVKTCVYAATAWLGLIGLHALLEAAAVRDAPEGAGNELRIVRIAEANENLVLLRRVEVHANVEWLRCSYRCGLLVKLLANWAGFVGAGYRFNSLTAFGSRRPAGIWFRLQPVRS